MATRRIVMYCIGIIAVFTLPHVNAGTLNAEGSAQIYLSDDNWTIDQNSMQVMNTKNCTPEVKYKHDGKDKTIGSCTYKGSDQDVRGDFYYDFAARVLFRNDSTKGFSLNAKGVKCHYQLQTMGPPTNNYYYHVDCKLSNDKASIAPLGNASCPKECSVEVVNGQDGVMLKPKCK